ncbi:MAG: nucleotidyl transferase AbiEii/AbiGii toxin family protein [Lishizhenia sp.]
MREQWDKNIRDFVIFSAEEKLQILAVGGGAVNFHGYRRHSADVDFWINTTKSNLERLKRVLKKMNLEIDSFPDEVKEQKQNVSLNFSPASLNIELITKFSVNKTFEQAYEDSVLVELEDDQYLKWNVLSFDDLITSKIKYNRPKDLMDVQELIRIKEQ